MKKLSLLIIPLFLVSCSLFEEDYKCEGADCLELSGYVYEVDGITPVHQVELAIQVGGIGKEAFIPIPYYSKSETFYRQTNETGNYQLSIGYPYLHLLPHSLNIQVSKEGYFPKELTNYDSIQIDTLSNRNFHLLKKTKVFFRFKKKDVGTASSAYPHAFISGKPFGLMVGELASSDTLIIRELAANQQIKIEFIYSDIQLNEPYYYELNNNPEQSLIVEY